MELEYCVYITTYYGELLPKYYIGSTTVKKIESGKYFGSVSSKKWKSIFKDELLNNSQLFSVKIYSYHSTRKIALEEELKIQIENNVVKSKDYMNESLALINGMFGRDVTGKNNPMFGKKREDSSKRMSGENNIAKREDIKIKLRKPKSKITPHNHTEKSKNKLRFSALNRSEDHKLKIIKGLRKRSDIKYGESINILISKLLINNGSLSIKEICEIFNDKNRKDITNILRISKNRNMIYCTMAGINSTWHLKNNEFYVNNILN